MNFPSHWVHHLLVLLEALYNVSIKQWSYYKTLWLHSKALECCLYSSKNLGETKAWTQTGAK